MAQRDPLGYYTHLGVAPTATLSEIKAAYRSRAMDLHPDRNPGRDTTKKFEELQQAYEVLSSPDLRTAYDASAVDPAASRAESAEPARYKPIYCSRCNCVSAMPRYRVFYSVVGYIFGATKRPHQGIFCARCETIVALRATAITAVFGWWSIHGFFWSIEAILKNLVGGPSFLEQDVRLLAYQAGYFAAVGKRALARAVAGRAYAIAQRAAKGNSKIARMKARLGYAADDPLPELREKLRGFLDSFEGEGSAPELRGTSRLWNARFGSQLGLLTAIALSIGGWSFVEQQRATETERIRLEKIGMEHAAAQAVAQHQAAELRKHERPLPISGLHASYIPSDKRGSGNLPPFKIITNPGANYFLKLCDWSNGRAILSIFIRGGEEVEAGIPPGTYRIKFASGATWYGEDIRFGPDTDYSVADKPFEFAIQGNQLIGQELRLVNIRDGNLRRSPITASEF